MPENFGQPIEKTIAEEVARELVSNIIVKQGGLTLAGKKLNMLAQGDRGRKGSAGRDGKDGISPKDGRDGKNGKDGRDGKTPVKGVDYTDGVDGSDGENGTDAVNGKDGLPGRDGNVGAMPKHEWKKTKLRFQNPDGSWGEWTDLRGLIGEGKLGFPGKTGKDGLPGIPPAEIVYLVNELHSLKQRVTNLEPKTEPPVIDTKKLMSELEKESK